MSIEFAVHGARELKRKLEALAKKARAEAKIALRLEAEYIMTAAKKRFVPVAEVRGGTLRNSGFVGRVEDDGDELSVRLGFGGAAAPYALAIHEHPSEHSPISWRGKTLKFHLGGEVGVKYLERPLNQAIPGMADRMAKHIRII